MHTLPIFVSHYSLGKSILTLENPKDVVSNGPESIIKIAKENNLQDVYLAENNMSGFVTAYKNCKANDLNLHFGLQIIMCNDMRDKNAESLNTEHKIVIWANNDEGYKKLVKLYSSAATEGFYYQPRLDSNLIRNYWIENDLTLSIPFYDSFIHKNLLYGGNCLPDLGFANPFMHVENNSLPFNFLIKDKVEKWSQEMKWDVVPTKTIYYKEEEDFLYYMAYRCITEGSTLDMPNIEHFGSHEFSLETWKKGEANV